MAGNARWGAPAPVGHVPTGAAAHAGAARGSWGKQLGAVLPE
ncbi:hypothetical protein HMPREF9005_0557 [Actinomyces sp. oral taxon 178 str. F0338]|nr:hypothetical protein HMPREF9005_0557 [Actinomyces sp. oral taxon 178 str. F0338]